MSLNPIKSIVKFFKYWKKHGWNKTSKDLKYNYLMLETPENLLKKEITSYIGVLGALLLALVFLAFRGFWYISLIMLFSIAISYYQMKGKLIQLKKLKEMTEQFENPEERKEEQLW